MRSLPAPNHPVLLCCACSSMSVPSSHWVAQTGHNTQVQHHRWGGNHTLCLCSQFSRLFTTTAHAQLLFNLLSTRTPSMSFLQCCCPGPAYRVTQGCFLSGAGLALVWAESHKVPVSLLKALWIAALPCSVTATLANLVSSPNTLRVLSIPPTRPLKTTLSSAVLGSKLYHK